MRPIYRRRHDVLVAELAQHLPELRPVGVAAGMHLLAWLPDAVDETAAIETAARAGIRLDGVTPYRLGHAGPGGLILGYATLNESAIPDAVRSLARVLHAAGLRRSGSASGG